MECDGMGRDGMEDIWYFSTVEEVSDGQMATCCACLAPCVCVVFIVLLVS